MALFEAILYIVAVALLALVGTGIIPARAGYLAAACALLAFALPTIVAGAR